MKKVHSQLLFTDDFDKSHSEIIEAGGRVGHQLSDKVFVAHFDKPDGHLQLKHSSGQSTTELDETSSLMVKAWRNFKDKQSSKEKKADSVHQHATPVPENTPGSFPQNASQKKKNTPGAGATTQRLAGKVVVGLLVVSGEEDNLIISESELDGIITDVFTTFDFLTDAGGAAADLMFQYSLRPFKIDAIPNSSCSSEESCELVFRDPVLKQMGYQPGVAGCEDFVNNLKKNFKADAAYAVFITKYSVGLWRSSYASGVRISINYNLSKYQLSAELLESTCTLFGGSYEAGDCTCNGSGFYNVPNHNCVNCRSKPFSDNCIMVGVRSELSLCSWTKGQIGMYSTKCNNGVPAIRLADNGDEQIVYRDTTVNNQLSHIYDFALTLGWGCENLGCELGVPGALGDPRICQNTQSGLHIVYRNEYQNIGYIGPDWTYKNLTSDAKAPQAKGNPCIIQTKVDPVFYIVYRDVNDQVALIYGRDLSWQYMNISAAAAGSPKANGDPQIIELPNGDLEIVFVDESQKLAEVRFFSGTWTYYNLGLVKNAPPAAGDPCIISYAGRNYLFIVYRDISGSIASLNWDGKDWYYDNVTKLTNTPLAAGNPQLIQFTPNELNLIYRNADGEIYELIWRGQWAGSTNIMEKVDAARAGSDPIGVLKSSNGVYVIYYRDVNQQISRITGYLHSIWSKWQFKV